MPLTPQTRIGISGWTYAPWRGAFYPKDVTQKRELEYASRQLNSIEINGTFYSLQTPASFSVWYDATPADFIFSLKGGRFITHIRRLKEVDIPLANFFASGVLNLKEKLGPILWQFPPAFLFDEETFDAFFKLLPRTTTDAAKLAKRHDARMKAKASFTTDAEREIRYAVEIRHESFKNERFVKLLRKHKIALVIADTAGKWPLMEDITADFVYIRLHGDEQLYVSGYTDAALESWAERIRAWRSGKEPRDARRVLDATAPRRKSRDVFVYFDNDVKVRSPFDAMNLAAKLEGRASIPAPAELPNHSSESPRSHGSGVKRVPSTRGRKRSEKTRASGK
jgi:uncharacterized protein YecE (DUF72 family)